MKATGHKKKTFHSNYQCNDFYPRARKGRRGIAFTHGVWMGGRAGGWAA